MDYVGLSDLEIVNIVVLELKHQWIFEYIERRDK